MVSDYSRHWSLDPGITFLNHGSFGACPLHVLDKQRLLREEFEREPVLFFMRRLEGLLDGARGELGRFVGAEADDLAFVPNATTGVNTVLCGLPLEPGDELLVTDHEYNACRNAIDFAASRGRAKVVVVHIPFPVDSADSVFEKVLARVTGKTRLALLDHVTSPTGLLMPIGRLVEALSSRGVDALVDGAHAPGMIPLDLRGLGSAYYTGNCHKWLCAPKGAAFLHVRRDKQAEVRPLVISHGANSKRADRSRFRLEFDWMGTDDPTPYLCIPEAIRFLGSLLPGGWPELMARNRALALEARRSVCGTLGIGLPCPDEMIGSMAAMPCPDGPLEPPHSVFEIDPLQDVLWERYKIEVPIFSWPAAPKRLLRISAQIYNSAPQYARLSEALREILPLPAWPFQGSVNP